jgi:predicted nucleotidyltransferase
MDDLKRILPELKAALERRYGERLVKLILFGSHARGEATEDSDIDVLAVVENLTDGPRERFEVSAIAADISCGFDTLINLVLTSARDYGSRNTPLLMNIRREGVEV